VRTPQEYFPGTAPSKTTFAHAPSLPSHLDRLVGCCSRSIKAVPARNCPRRDQETGHAISTTSDKPSTPEATTARPAAMASAATNPNPSNSDGTATKSIRLYKLKNLISIGHPAPDDKVFQSYLRCVVFEHVRIGHLQSPAAGRGKGLEDFGIASSNRTCPFSWRRRPTHPITVLSPGRVGYTSPAHRYSGDGCDLLQIDRVIDGPVARVRALAGRILNCRRTTTARLPASCRRTRCRDWQQTLSKAWPSNHRSALLVNCRKNSSYTRNPDARTG